MFLCRVCMKGESFLSSISSYSNKFYDITGILIHLPDESFICKDCIFRLSQAVEFREQAITADEFFKRETAEIKIETAESPSRIEIIERTTTLEKNPPKKCQKQEVLNKERLCETDDKVEKKDEIQTKYLKNFKIIDRLKVRSLKVTKQNPAGSSSGVPLKNHYTENHANSDEKRLKPYVCEFCGRLCSTKYKLDLHTRSHTNIRPYECTQCKSKFKQPADLNTHMKSIHSDERPYLCLVSIF